MIGRYEVWLNDIALSSVNPNIIISDIQHSAVNIRNETFSTVKRHGARLHRQYIDRMSCTIQFEIRAYDIAERQSICADVIRWAKNGGILKTNDRPWQRLRCICDRSPAIQSALRWTDTLQITFNAYALPFWEEENPAILHLSGTSAEGELYVPGNMDGAMIEVSATVNSALTSLSLSANGKSIQLNGLSIAAGGIIELKYDNDMIQSIKANGVSILNKRSGVDDLLAKCGEINTLSFSSDADVSVVFSVRGLWL